MAKITITGLNRAEDDLFKRVDRPGTHSYETSIPPAGLKLGISQIASELGKHVRLCDSLLLDIDSILTSNPCHRAT